MCHDSWHPGGSRGEELDDPDPSGSSQTYLQLESRTSILIVQVCTGRVRVVMVLVPLGRI